ncbi:hypothetical protein MMC28_001310 [Mycoblastus sanguinarius]|nr:hypothetical protein [Mycoblastus sanguinarius]
MAESPSHLVSFDIEPGSELEKNEQKRRFFDFKWLRREEQTSFPDPKLNTLPQTPHRPSFGRRLSRKVGVGIPRSTTFKRQEDEQRKNLTPVEPSIKERRETSKVRQRALSAQPEPPRILRTELSVPEDLHNAYSSIASRIETDTFIQLSEAQQEQTPPSLPPPPPSQPPPQDPSSQRDEAPMTEVSYDDAVDEEIREELEKKWILNLSMHFRDKSPREKFFLTYAEAPHRWRRVTVSCDYRDAPPDSLEQDLQNLNVQKDKSARIYESIRMSLPDIQFYDTVTNLKLETKDDRLHVHVTEDVNEIIHYPPSTLVNHLPCTQYKESELHFNEHMSGFVYKVSVGDSIWIKKEIPGPDSVDEFLYEINALNELVDSTNVIQLQGLVVNDEGTLVKGLLLSYAEQGALVDIIYDSKKGYLDRVPWSRREQWAKDIIKGLSEIHEAGFVQGDFTLSNIVIDENNVAKIIDINRRGCPVGWEPPEMVPLVESAQRLSMYIGVKSDLYQLGMVLWALATEDDLPERQKRPLSLNETGEEIPDYYRELTSICLRDKPKERLAAKDLLLLFNRSSDHLPPQPLFPEIDRQESVPLSDAAHSLDPISGRDDSGYASRRQQRPASKYPQRRGLDGDQGEENDTAQHMDDGPEDRDPNYRLDLRRRKRSDCLENADVEEERPRGRQGSSRRTSSLDFPFDGPGSAFISSRGRQPGKNLRHLESSDRSNVSPGHSDIDEAQIVPVSPTGERQWEEINMDGTPYLVHRDTLDDFDEEDFQSARRGKGYERLRREVEHVDSGLADMDFGDTVARDRFFDLAGVGMHENLSIDQHKHGKDSPQGIADDLGTERNDGEAQKGS